MISNSISFSRRHVLGELYDRCDSLLDNIPVYMEGTEPELLGHADESLGHYADAFSFHIGNDMCKKLSAGHFSYSFDYRFSDAAATGSRSRITLTAITLIGPKSYGKPLPRGRGARVEAEAAPVVAGN